MLAIACYSAPSRLALDAHCSPKETQFATFRGIARMKEFTDGFKVRIKTIEKVGREK